MIDFLIRRCIKHADNTSDAKVRTRYGALSSGVGILCNLLLFAVKFLLGTLSGSIAIKADAFNNLSDVGSSAVTLAGFKMASKPADKDHPYGHGRIEYLCGLLIAFFILMVGIEFVKNSVEKILHPEPILFSYAVLAGLVVSVLVKLWMNRFNLALSKRIDSPSLAATAADSLSDAMATGVTMVSVIASAFTDLPVDGVIGLIVAVMILKAGYGVAQDTLNPLLGSPPDPALVKDIKERMLTYPDIIGVHDLIVHDYGPGRIFVSAHAEVPANGNILNCHDTVDTAEREISRALNLQLVIHMDPIETECEATNTLKKVVESIISQVDESLSIHDFRVVIGPSHTNLIFDLVLPMESRWSPKEISELIDKKIREVDSHVFTVITVDRDYV